MSQHICKSSRAFSFQPQLSITITWGFSRRPSALPTLQINESLGLGPRYLT